jgi:hypothetical protein
MGEGQSPEGDHAELGGHDLQRPATDHVGGALPSSGADRVQAADLVITPPVEHQPETPTRPAP